MTDRPQPPAESVLEQLGWLQRLARSLVRDGHEAEDLAQETMLAAIRRPPDRERGVRGFLATVARNRAKSGRTRESRRVQRERRAFVPESTAEPLDLLERAELQQALVNAVMELAEPYREVLLLRFFEGHSPQQIAERRGTSAATTRSQIKRGLDLLRARLDQRFGDEKSWRTGLLALLQCPPASWVAASGTGVAGSAATAANATTVSAVNTATIQTSSLAAGLAWGGIIMSLKTVGVAVITVTLVGVGTWFALKDPAPDTARKTANDTVASERIGSETEDRESAAETTTAQPTSDLKVSSESSGNPTGITEAGPGSLRGTIRDADGSPIEGIVVHAYSTPPELKNLELPMGIQLGGLIGGAVGVPDIDSKKQRAESQADGSFAIEGLEPGIYSAIARGQSFLQQSISEIEVSETQPGVAEFTLEPGLSIEGIVFDPNGSPVAGAVVTAGSGMIAFGGEDGAAFSMVVNIAAPGESSVGGVANAKTTTDENGIFRLEGLKPGNQQLVARHESWAESSSLQVAAGSRAVELQLRIGGQLVGTVVGPDGKPLSGVPVFTSSNSIEATGSARADSDAQGRFVLKHVRPGPVRLRAMAEGLPETQSERFRVEDGGLVEDIVLQFEAAWTLSGVILDADGEPLAGASVERSTGSVFPDISAFSGAMATTRARRVMTDADGRFEMNDLAPESALLLTVRHDAHLDEQLEFSLSSETTTLDPIQLRRGGVVTGTITDAATGEVIPDARVQVLQHQEDTSESFMMFDMAGLGGGANKSVKSNGKGIYEIRNVEPGDYKIRVKKSGYAAFLGDPFTIGEGQVFTVNGELGGGAAITGSVVGAGSFPIAGAKIRAMSFQPEFTQTQAVTDENGKFSLEGLDAEATYQVSVSAKGWSPKDESGVATGSTLHFQLEEPGGVAGVVTDLATGLPVETFSVKAKRSGGRGRSHIGFSAMDFGQGSKFQSPSGEFELASLAPGRYRLVVRAEGFVRSESDEIVVRSGQVTEAAIALDLGGAVDGYVRDSSGNPIAGVVVQRAKGGADGMIEGVSIAMDSGGGAVSASFGGSNEARARTDENGYFLLSSLPVGEIDLKVSHKGYRDQEVEAVEIERSLTRRIEPVVLDRGATVRGTVRGTDGAPVSRGAVTIQRLEEKWGQAPKFVMLDEGKFEQGGLEPGKYRVTAQNFGDGGGITMSTGGAEEEGGHTRVITLSGEDERTVNLQFE